MKQHVLILTALSFSTTNSFFLRRVGEDLHNAVNSVIPHEHRLLPLGKWHHHHHHHASQEDGYHHPDSEEDHHGFRRGPPRHRPTDHSHGQDCYSHEKGPLENDTKKEVGSTEVAVQVDTTTAVQIDASTMEQQVDVTTVPAAEEPESFTVMPIDVRSAEGPSSRRLINPGSNCGNGQKSDATGRCRAVFG